MAEAGWTPEERERRLPRLEDLPTAPDGYDPQAVREAFDAFYRHAAELDSTLRSLEAVDAFQRQAEELRSDIRSLRAASWAPAQSFRGEPWYIGQRRRARTGPGGAVSDAFPRVVVETAFILLVAVGAAVAGVSTLLVVALVAAAWAIVGAVEVVAAVAGPRLRRRRGMPVAAAGTEPAPTIVAPPLPAEARERAVAEEPPPLSSAAAAPAREPPEEKVDEGPVPEPAAPADAEPASVEVARAEESVELDEVEPEEREPVAVADEPAPVEVARAEEPVELDEAEPEEREPVAVADEPAPAVHAAASRDPWEAGPQLPGGEPLSDAAEVAQSRFRFWRRRRRSEEEEALLPEPTGHVNVISVRPAVSPDEVRVPRDGGAVDDVAAGVRPVEGWRPPPGYERDAVRLRRGRR